MDGHTINAIVLKVPGIRVWFMFICAEVKLTGTNRFIDVWDLTLYLTPEIWSHVRLKRSKKGGDEEAQNELFTSFRHQRYLDHKISSNIGE
ncbi:hypothetical protein J6590_003047 [Homalodisca vitripennis]|nr:hypothetical protein J6590_003047 [Homalodisca vitripennis]